MKQRWLEFFYGEHDQLSMYRLLQFLAYFPATATLLWIHTTEALSMYLLAFVTNGVAGKFIDMKGRANVANSTKLDKK
jgi:hypothetical protein